MQPNTFCHCNNFLLLTNCTFCFAVGLAFSSCGGRKQVPTVRFFKTSGCFMNHLALSFILYYYTLCTSVYTSGISIYSSKDLCLKNNPNTLFFLFPMVFNRNVIWWMEAVYVHIRVIFSRNLTLKDFLSVTSMVLMLSSCFCFITTRIICVPK